MIVHSTEQMKFQAEVAPLILDMLTRDMTPGDKSTYLWHRTNWHRPWVGFTVIQVPDPAGGMHHVSRTILETSDGPVDEYICREHGSCWGAAHAARAYRAQTGIDSLHILQKE